MLIVQRKASTSDLGIDNEKKELPWKQITASSFKDNDTQPHMARLNNPFYFRAWCSKLPAENQWLQFDLGHTMIVTGIVTQAKGGPEPQWLKLYKVKCEYKYIFDC